MAISRFVRRDQLPAVSAPLLRRRAGASLVAFAVTAVSSTATFAQLSPQTNRTAASAAPSLDMLMPAAEGGTWALPARPETVVVVAELQGIVDDLLLRSVTFRRQWYRLVRSPRLAVRIRLVHRSPVADSHAATEIIARPDGSLLADVAIPGGARVAEVVGHEVEHVLERLDGARVAALHAAGDQSVRRASGSFETARAVLVGRLVSGEFHNRQ